MKPNFFSSSNPEISGCLVFWGANISLFLKLEYLVQVKWLFSSKEKLSMMKLNLNVDQ